jgi:hypothetical protein
LQAPPEPAIHPLRKGDVAEWLKATVC